MRNNVPENIKKDIKVESESLVKNHLNYLINGFFNLLKTKKLEVSVDIHSSRFYLPAKKFYTLLFYSSIKIYSKIDDSYKKYSDLSLKDFEKIIDKIEITPGLYTVISTMFISVINIGSELFIKSLKNIMNKSTKIKSVFVLMISIILYGVIKLTKNSSELNQIENLLESIKTKIQTLNDENIALLIYTLFIAPYIEETFKAFCLQDTKLGLEEIVITTILEEAIKSYILKSQEIMSGLLNELHQSAITPYSVPIRSVKDVITRILLLATTSSVLKLGKKFNKRTLSIVINIITHMFYNTYMLSKVISGLK